MSSKRNPREDQDQEGQEKPEGPKYTLELHWKHEANRAPLRIARDLYFKEYTYEQIFLKTGVPPSVFNHRQVQWAKLKSRLDEKYLIKLRARVLSKDATDIMKKGTQIIGLFFDRVIKRGTEVDAKDVKLTSDILANLHRIKQLEEGKPTDISVYENMTPEQAQAYLKSIQKAQSESHDMSMFGEDNEAADKKELEDYQNGNNSRVH